VVDILILPEKSLLMWAQQPEAPAELLAGMQAGRWRPPEEVAACLGSARQGSLRGREAGALVVVTPRRVVGGLLYGVPRGAPGLSAQDERLRGWVRAGLTDDQIALRVGRSPRWVRAQLARIRRHAGLPQRLSGTRRYR